MGHGDAFKVEDFRRMLANACYWCMGLESRIDPKASVEIGGVYEPGPVGAKGLKPDLKPSDLLEAAKPATAVRAFIDDASPGWRSLGKDDFAQVNSAKDTWSWEQGVLHCTGQPVSVLRKCPRAAVRLPSRSIGLSGESATSWRREPLRFHQGFLPLGGT
jgi:hypothetical protein